MVALKSPTLTETYGAICKFLQASPSLSVAVTNHIAAKHGIHSLPAFHQSEALSEADKLATYREIAVALTSGNHAALLGQKAAGQAKEAKEETPAKPVLPHPKAVSPNDTPANARHVLGGDGTHSGTRYPAPLPATSLGADGLPERPPAIPERPPSKPPVEQPRRSDPLTEQLRNILRELLGEMPGTLDESKVGELIDAKLAEFKPELPELPDVDAIVTKAIADAVAKLPKPEPTTTRIEFVIGGEVRPIAGLAHRQLPQIIAWLNANVPVWLWGMAGGGKTTLTRQCGDALGLKSYIISIDETITVGKLLGFRNVSNGEYVEGLIYRAYKEGGVVCLDEGDTNATTLASMNSLIANDRFLFPNGEDVEKHKDFRIIMGGNTKGTGAVAGYTARVRMDAATLDRFAVIKLDYDEDMELAICCGVPINRTPWTPGKPASDAECRAYVDWVLRVRKHAGDSVLVSPRASMLGVRALRAGIPMAEVVEALVFKLVTPDTRVRLQNLAGSAP